MKTLSSLFSILILSVLLISCEKNQPPSCQITGPENGSIFTMGEKISISVQADDNEGAISEARLFLNGSGLAELDFPFKYEIDTEDYNSGLYSLKVTVRDVEGLEASDEIEFTINATLAEVTTNEATSISYNSAVAGGSVSYDGGGQITETGIYWDTLSSPETAGKKVPIGKAAGEFSAMLGDLPYGKQIFIKAYATNSAGESLGQELNFETNTVPTVQTTAASSITVVSAEVGGVVMDDGGESITQTGIFWSAEPNAEISGTQLIIESTEGLFNTVLNDLVLSTTYYVRAYADNAAGRSLGNEISFTTGSGVEINTLQYSMLYKWVDIFGEVTDDGGSEVTEKGFYWGTSTEVITSGTKISVSLGSGLFSTTLANLIPGTTYYYVAYAVSDDREYYGSELSFEVPSTEIATFVDSRDQEVYEMVEIGDQVWMAENLRATKFNDGAEIPNVTDDNTWSNNSGSAYCWYNNDPAITEWGALYNWTTVNTGKLCPTGWHVPTDQEWKQLEMFLGMDEATANLGGFRGTNEGGMLKHTDLWESPNTGATNEVKFSVIPSGLRYPDGRFAGRNTTAFIWASDPADGSDPIRRHFFVDYGTISRAPAKKAFGFSVRCVKD